MRDDVFDETNVVARSLAVGFPKQMRVRANRQGLTIGDEATIPSDRIVRAYLVPKEGERPRVFVDVKRGRQIHIDVLTRAEGNRLLRALGWDLDQRSIAFSGKAETWVVIVSTLAWYVLLGTLAAPWLGRASMVLWVLAALWLLRSRIEIGADGVTIHRYFRSRFISYRDVGRVRIAVESSFFGSRSSKAYNHYLVLERSGLSNAKVKLDGGEGTLPWTEGVLDRVQTACDAFHGRAPIDLPNELARGRRDAKEWIAALRTLGSGGAQLTYRVATVEPERLLAVVESPTEPPSVRAAAAVALAKSASLEQRERLEKSSGTVAEPHLRVALAAALHDDEEALEAALHALEASESEQG